MNKIIRIKKGTMCEICGEIPAKMIEKSAFSASRYKVCSIRCIYNDDSRIQDSITRSNFSLKLIK